MAVVLLIFTVLLQLLNTQAFVDKPRTSKESSISNTEQDGPNCIIPLPPKNGKIKVLGKGKTPKVGDRVYNYVIDVSCDRGYYLTGWILVGCDFRGRNDTMPECVPLCKKSTPELISCGDGHSGKEARCLVPLNGIGILTREGMNLRCGEIPRVVTTSVSGGRRAGKKEVPWHVGVYKKTSRPYSQICGGTLVAPQLVISAAHCFWNDLTKKQPASHFAVAAGKIYRPYQDRDDEHAQYSDVDEIRIPPRYQGAATKHQDDIALLFTTTAFTHTDVVVPACLDFEHDFDDTQLSNGRKGKVAGWGLTSEDGPPSQVLRVAELPVIDIEKCIATTDPGSLDTITSDKICAGYNNGTAVCRGDSGGGFLVPEILSESLRFFLRGIISTAPTNEHQCNIYSTARFTHINKHEHFIKKAISQQLYAQLLKNQFDPIGSKNNTLMNNKNTNDIGVTSVNTNGNDKINDNHLMPNGIKTDAETTHTNNVAKTNFKLTEEDLNFLKMFAVQANETHLTTDFNTKNGVNGDCDINECVKLNNSNGNDNTNGNDAKNCEDNECVKFNDNSGDSQNNEQLVSNGGQNIIISNVFYAFCVFIIKSIYAF